MKTRTTIILKALTFIPLGLMIFFIVPAIFINTESVWFFIGLLFCLSVLIFTIRKIMEKRLKKDVLSNVNMTLDHHGIKSGDVEINMQMMVQKDRLGSTIKKYQEGDTCWHIRIDINGRAWSEKARRATVKAVVQGYKLMVVETEDGKLEVAPTYALEKS